VKIRGAAAGLVAVPVGLFAYGAGWSSGAPLPQPRSEVAAAALGKEIAIVGGFDVNGGSSARVDLYAPARDSWRRLPDLPVTVNHAAAAAAGGRLYVVGGYSAGFAGKLRRAFVYSERAWHELPRPPAARAAAGAAIAGGKLYVAGGRSPNGLAQKMLVFDIAGSRWSTVSGPIPREHLAVTAAGGRIYVVGGRKAGYDTNLRAFESYSPASGLWRRLPALPSARGGTGAAAAAGLIVSVGGEEPVGTIASVYAYDLARGRWRALPSLPTPRHGLGVAAVGKRVYVIGGGTEPGLSVSNANESLALG
jgi:non-specific serine/threonine protein kinase